MNPNTGANIASNNDVNWDSIDNTEALLLSTAILPIFSIINGFLIFKNKYIDKNTNTKITRLFAYKLKPINDTPDNNHMILITLSFEKRLLKRYAFKLAKELSK